MPLVRFEVRNEFGLGAPELYRGANKDDPKAFVDGLAVAGLVGILRQLGDLAEFAAEVFHDLQEQVMFTAARSHKMRIRVQQIETALPPLEKDVLSQESHLHLSYSTDSDWHANNQTEQNHFIHGAFPQFIMDSYEECRDAPRLHLLDKFDIGGPGACMKRYSDPSLFKRALVSSDPNNAKKVQREMKTLKSKIKGSPLGNVEVSHAVSISCTRRMKFASPNIYGPNYSVETTSTLDMRSKSELGDHFTSLDSGSRSGYTEGVFYVSSSMQQEEQEHSGLSTSRLKMHSSGSIGSILPDDEHGGSDNVFPQRSLQGQSVANPSVVAWDEKTEIVKPVDQPSELIAENQEEASELMPVSSNLIENQDEASELMPVTSDLIKLENEAARIIHLDPEDVLHRDENIPVSHSDGNQLDEVGSGPENYVDAHNTIVSEIQTGFECQTKWEVELPSANFKNNVKECGLGTMHRIISQTSDSADVEPCESYGSSNKQISHSFYNSVSSYDLVCTQLPQVISVCSNPHISVDTDLCESTDLIDFSRVKGFEFAISESSSGLDTPNLQLPSDDKNMNSLCESEESHAEISDGPSTKFWTNGVLLGLEPSKPPDCSVLMNLTSQNSKSGAQVDGPSLSSDPVMPKYDGDGSISKPEMLVKTPESIENPPYSKGGRDRTPDYVSSTDLPPDQLVRRMGNMLQNIGHTECSTSPHDKQDKYMLKDNSLEFLSTISKAKLEKPKDSCHSRSFSNTQRYGLLENGVMTPGVVPDMPDVKGTPSETNQENIESSSSIFGLGQRLFVNGLRRKIALVHGDTSEPSSSVKSGPIELQEPHCIEQKVQNRIVCQTLPESNTKEQLKHGSPTNSFSSSPPLEHMKFSFHPVDGFDTSQMNSIKDVIFPSFQFLPEPTIESDDDTFCRSSQYMSDDLMSQHSESNSEQWESSETPGRKDHKKYDALCRVLSAESILSALELEGIFHDNIYPDCDFKCPDSKNGIKPIQSSSLLNLPNLNAVDPLTSQQEIKCRSDAKDPYLASQYPNEQTPPLPPLPPEKWLVMKPNFSVAQDNQGPISGAVNHQYDLQVLGSTDWQKPMLAHPKQPHIKEATACAPKSKVIVDHQKLNGHREANQAVNGKDRDEKEDILHQIRSKSLSLRRTVPARPTITRSPTTNIKMTAILEKANAIRQAFVGSDEEADENWSDC